MEERGKVKNLKGMDMTGHLNLNYLCWKIVDIVLLHFLKLFKITVTFFSRGKHRYLFKGVIY